MTERYLVKCRTSRSQSWGAIIFCDTREEALDISRTFFDIELDDNTYLDVRIEKQVI